MSQVIQVTDQNFQDEVENYTGPMMVEFYATWCPHCQRMEPVIKKLAQEYAGKVKFVAVDIDKSPKSSDEYEIQGTPTLFFFSKDGGEPNSISGEQSVQTLKEFLDEII